MGEEIPVAITKCFSLEGERKAIYEAAEPTIKSGFAFLARATSEYGDIEEHLILMTLEPLSFKTISRTEKIMLEEVPICSMVEYRFTANEDWKISHIGVASLKHWRKAKFKIWLEMLKKPTCAAQLRRMLEIGLITNLYDEGAFPTPEADKEQYEVKDHNGKVIQIPHPVNEMRAWNAKDRCYEQHSTRLDEAPPPENEKEFWESILQSFREAQVINEKNEVIMDA